MAEYYAVLKKAVGGLDSSSAEARRAVYDKARNALIGQLKAIDPPLAASEISRQRLELEEAIRRVERETAAEAQGARYQRAPESEAAPSTVPDQVPAAAGQPSPQDVFRRAIQEAESRGAAALNSLERAPVRGGGSSGGYDQDVRPAGDWAQGGRPDYRDETRAGTGGARLAPDYDNDWQARDTAARMPADPYLDRRDRRRQAKPKGYPDEDGGELPEREARRSRLPTILLVVLILGMIGGLAALGWSQRTVIADLLAGLDGGPVEETTPAESAIAPPDSASTKSDDRLPDGEADSPVRTVGESESGIPQLPDAIAETIAGAPTSDDALVAQKAVLYEEPLDAATAASGVTAINAVVTWRFIENGAAGAEVEANIEVPERAMKIRLSIRRNTDPSLPASHLVEVVIDTPADFPGKGIRSIPRLVIKANEDERGEPLIGAAAKVADGFFWIALSATETDVASNLQLLRDRPWIDVPVVYETGQRAILTFEKGTPGQRVFERALAAWSTG